MFVVYSSDIGLLTYLVSLFIKLFNVFSIVIIELIHYIGF